MKKYYYNPKDITAVVHFPKQSLREEQVFVHIVGGIVMAEKGEDAKRLLDRVQKERPDMFDQEPKRVDQEPKRVVQDLEEFFGEAKTEETPTTGVRRTASNNARTKTSDNKNKK